MTSVNGYSNYSQTGMYIPSYMQTPGTTTTTTNTTTTTTSEKKDGVGMGTVLLAGAAILGGIITFKNGGLKNTFKQIGKLFGKNADDAAKNLNLLEKGKALIKGTNAKKGTDAVGEALSAAAGKTEKAKWSETLGDMYKSIKNKFTTKSNTDDIAQEAAERTANEQAAKEFAEQSQKEYFGRVDQTTGKSAKESAAVFEEAAEKAKVSLQQRKTEAEATIAQYGKDSIEGKEAARDLVKIENELKNYTTTSQPTNIQEILDEIAQEEQIADLRQAGR